MSILLLLLLLFLLYALYYLFYLCAKPTLLHSDERKVGIGSLLEKCTHLYAPYLPLPYLPGGTLMSLAAASARKKPLASFYRERFAISDGGTSAIDWFALSKYEEAQNANTDTASCPPFFSSSACPNTDPLAPIFLLLHGMNGGSMESYARWMCIYAAKKLGWKAGVVISRGCCGLRLSNWRVYNAGWTLDLKEVVSVLRARWPDAPIVACGVSLGGNILANYVGEEGAACPLTAAVSISNPIDLVESSKIINGSFIGKHLFSPYITIGLKRLMEKNKEEIMKGPYELNFDEIRKCKTNDQFDELASCKAFGLEHAVDYYKKYMCKPKLPHITIPMLFITAVDDPMLGNVPVKAFQEVASDNPNIAMAVTRTGGHYGFFEVSDMLSLKAYIDFSTQTWSEKVTFQFFEKALERKK